MGEGSGFPETAGALLERLGSLYGLVDELEPARRVAQRLRPVLLETSVSLRPGTQTDLRLTLGIPPRPDDPQGRSALLAALSGLGAGRVSAPVDAALAHVAGAPREGELARSLALRARSGEPVQPRPGARVGGRTGAERFARAADAMRSVGLERAAAVQERIAAEFRGNPFNAVIPYGLGFDLRPDRALGAKTYLSCEWPDVAVGFMRGRLADELGLKGVEVFELLAAIARADWRRERWLLEVSFELPADPARGVRAKAYVSTRRLASSEAEAHKLVLRIAAGLGIDLRPYEELVEAVRPDGLTPERPCSLRAGVSASSLGPSLEVYLFDPARFASTAAPAATRGS